jgi:hypothetical protein
MLDVSEQRPEENVSTCEGNHEEDCKHYVLRISVITLGL